MLDTETLNCVAAHTNTHTHTHRADIYTHSFIQTHIWTLKSWMDEIWHALFQSCNSVSKCSFREFRSVFRYRGKSLALCLSAQLQYVSVLSMVNPVGLVCVAQDEWMCVLIVMS